MSEFHEWCGNFECGECYDCKCHQIGIMMSSNETLQTQLKDAQADIQTQKANLLSQGRLLVEAREEVERLKESLKIDIGDLVMIDDEPQFVSAIVSDPVLKVYYWLDNQELSVTADEIDCHFVNMNRVNEPKQ